jgi:putative acetyltransferase
VTVRIAPEAADERAAVAEIIARAFGRADEALLVEALRNAGDLCLSLVARNDAGLIGHIAFQPVTVEGAPAVKAASLAPLSVLPGQQRQGIGSQLVRAGLEALRQNGTDIVFVLGDPGYYGRFGFSAGAAAAYATPWRTPHFQAVNLSPVPPRAGKLIYPAAFFESPV